MNLHKNNQGNLTDISGQERGHDQLYVNHRPILILIMFPSVKKKNIEEEEFLTPFLFLHESFN